MAGLVGQLAASAAAERPGTAVGDRLPQRLLRDLRQLDQDGGIAVEVRDGEEVRGVRGEHGLLLAQVLDADSQDRPGHEPGPVAVPLALGDLGQPPGQPGHVVYSRHTRTVLPPVAALRYKERDRMSSSALLIMDVQQGIVDRFAQDADYLPRLASAADAARAAGITVIYVTVAFRAGYPEISPRNKTFSAIAGSGRSTQDDPGTRVHPAVAPQPGDVLVRKL